MARANLYIDGYNFYIAIAKPPKGRAILSNGWCNFRDLAEKHMLPDHDSLHRIKYFTARVEQYSIHPGERERQTLWLKAVKTISGLEDIYGYHWKKKNQENRNRTEKQTDVNIAVEMVVDAQDLDRLVLICGDMDLAPAAIKIAEKFKKRVDVWIPPGIAHTRWDEVAGEYALITCQEITAAMLADSRLPNVIQDGTETIRCPVEWQHKSR